MDPELHFEEVTTVSGDTRSQFEVYQPTAVLAGQELAKQLEMSLGATLENQPGVASRSFGPAPARPVIRGLDGDRVQILQDGQRMGDLSSQSGDHGVSDQSRGRATHRGGARSGHAALWRECDWRPRERHYRGHSHPTLNGATGNVTADLGSAAREAAARRTPRRNGRSRSTPAAAAAVRVTSTRRRARSTTRNRGTGSATSGLGWTDDRGYFGGSYGYDDTKYGIPVVEDGLLQLTPRRHSFVVARRSGQGLGGAFDSYRATLSLRRYKHEELEGEDVGTAVREQHRPRSR